MVAIESRNTEVGSNSTKSLLILATFGDNHTSAGNDITLKRKGKPCALVVRFSVVV